MIMLSGDPNKVYKTLQNLYVRSESLMINPEDYKPLLILLSDISECFENLTNLLKAFDEKAVLNIKFNQSSIVVEKQQFENHI